MRKTAAAGYRDPAGADQPGHPATFGTVSLRAILLGCLCSVAIAVGAPHTTMVLSGTPMGFSSCTPAAFFLLFVIITTLQPALGLLGRRPLTPSELLTVTAMMFVAAALPTRGVTGLLLPMITATYYYASPENEWADQLHPHDADWMLVNDQSAVVGFYEGGWEHIPWSSWLTPLGAWSLFYLSFYLALIGIVVILRRQWVDHERLPFPVARVPLALVAGERGDPWPAIFRSKALWLGMAIPLVVNSANALHHYDSSIPHLDLVSSITIYPGISLRVGINFLMVGFAYFISSSVAFSLWFFHLLKLLQMHVVGLTGGTFQNTYLGPWQEALLGQQAVGAFAVLVLSGLWFARRHLAAVLRTAWGAHGTADADDDEIVSYRGAVLGLVGGTGGMGLWLWLSGFPGWIAPLVVVVALVILLGLTRAVAEAGLPTVTPTSGPSGFLISCIGVPALGTTGMIATGYTLVWAGEYLVFFMAPLANAVRLGQATRGNRRRLYWSIWLAIAATLVVSVWYTLHLAYTYGGINLDKGFFTSYCKYPSELAAAMLADPRGPYPVAWLWTLSGGLVMAILTILYYRFTGWALHPLGFPIAASWSMHFTWFPIFLGWALKRIILRLGGGRVYRDSRPFFIGLIMGQFVAGGLWLVVDTATGTRGNVIPMLF